VIILAPMFTVFWAVLLLVAISIYDAIAVWKLKHMITLATAQAEEKMFAGLLIPYTKQKDKEGRQSSKPIESASVPNAEIKTQIKLSIPKGFKDGEVKSAILGGGDIAFPMIFSGSVMTWLIEQGISKNIAFLQVMIISLFAGIALFLLLVYSKKDRFYPAMPFISAGCFIGYGIVLLLQIL
jgi:presenilin-like A22 family membrane protease